jgi:threonine-phosphate decarboxylase
MIGGHGGNIFALARRLGCAPEDILDLSSNVNPLGPPPGLCGYLAARLDAVAVLPEVDSRDIVERYAARLGVPPECMAAGNGTTQFIYSVPSTLGVRRALIVGPTYSDYADSCRLQGIAPEYLLWPAADRFRPDLQRLSDAAAGADTVFVCNPNNPTGALIPGDDLRRVCAAHPRVRFVVDESYLPFAPDAERHSLVGCGLENVLVLLSISKIYRIPGLRIGFLVSAPAVIERFKGELWPWSVNGVAQAAVRFICDSGPAIDAFTADTRRHLERERRDLEERLGAIPGVIPYPSTVSFTLARLPDGLSAAAACSRLAGQRILIRDCSNFVGLSERFIRICPRSRDANRRVGAALSAWASEERARAALPGDGGKQG